MGLARQSVGVVHTADTGQYVQPLLFDDRALVSVAVRQSTLLLTAPNCPDKLASTATITRALQMDLNLGNASNSGLISHWHKECRSD
jgi:hypothetical protein